MRVFAQSGTCSARAAVVLVALALWACVPASASADFIFKATGNSSDGPLNAEAYFVLGNGQLTIYLANLTSGVQSQGDAISGISFKVSSPADTSLTLQKVAGNVVQVSGGSFTQQGYQTLNAVGGVAGNWAAQANNDVTDLGNPSNPHYMIVGPNASFNGGGGTNFNPYFQSTATSVFTSVPGQGQAVKFVLSAPGMTSSSTISNVVFNFGTSPNEHQANGVFVPPPAVVPAPPSALLAGLGGLSLLGLAGYARRRRAVVAAQ